ncbi:MAG: helix-turn-helix transcriptional regulator [Clostridium sp.]
MPNNILKGMRVMNGLKQDDMAKKLQITRAAYNRKENGKVEFTISEALIIANILDKNIEEIFLKENVTQTIRM